jgi:hypothetical protein
MWVEEGYRGGVFRAFKLPDTSLELGDGFTEELGSRLAFAVVVLA